MADKRDQINAGTVQENIRAIAKMQRGLERRRGVVDRIADAIGGFSGSMTFVLLHMAWFTAWFVINTGAIPGVKRFDPYPFILLAMVVSVEGVLLSTFVLMKQNRMQKKTDIRDHITLQTDLLSEKEVTKALQMLRAVCAKLEIHDFNEDCDLDEMARVTSVNMLSDEVEEDLVDER